MICLGCKRDEDCRMGWCFDCASAAEEKALRRSVFRHVCVGIKHLLMRRWWHARIDFSWALERLTGTGDYDQRCRPSG